MRSILLDMFGMGMLGESSTVVAQSDSADEIQALRVQVVHLSARLEALERSLSGSDEFEAVQLAPRPEPASSWPETVTVVGDLRYRHETINEEGLTERQRHRIRARLGISGELAANLSVGVGLTPGGDNPISGNQTLGDGFSPKDLGLEYAYFNWGST